VPHVNRSPGVTVSAVLLFVGSALAILFCSLMVVGLAVLPSERRPAPAESMLVFVGIFYLATAAWGIASGVGLLGLKEWARISTLIIGALLAFFCLLTMLFMLIMPLPQEPDVSPAAYAAFKAGFALVLAVPVAIGTWWLFYFNRKAVKQEFQGAGIEGAAISSKPARPLSISIIGWYLVISAICCIGILFLPIPIFLFYFLLRGQAARFVLFGMGVLQVVMGVALLRLKNWARIASICYFAFFGINGLAMVLIPGNSARYDAAISETQRMFGAPAGPIHVPLWAGLFFTLPLAIVLPWFLVTRKPAFLRAPELPPAPQAPHTPALP
jgi:hypothetical protein